MDALLTSPQLFRYRLKKLLNSSSSVALPQPVRLEPREISQTRRVAHEAEVEIWQEPDSRPIFTFMLRPRFIQEGIGCKLICCVKGKPQPKVKICKKEETNFVHFSSFI